MKYHYKIIDRILIIILLLLSFYIIFGHALIHNFNKKINGHNNISDLLHNHK